MKRYNLINDLIKKHGYISYLEIGTQLGNCISEVECVCKVGVDPEYNEVVENNSDIFWEGSSNSYFEYTIPKIRFPYEKFDIIFIDGLHEHKQVIRDIDNSLKILNKGGTIIVHDCNPQSSEAQDPVVFEGEKVIIPHRKTWNGDVWKAWVELKATREDLNMVCYDFDEGCGVITKGFQELIVIDNPINELSYSDLEKNRNYYLNLKEYKK